MIVRPEWITSPFDAFDTETTGVNPEDDRIVTASTLHVRPGESTQPTEFGWLVNPGIDIPEGATRVHGITTEKARTDGMDPAVAIREIRDMLTECWDSGRVLVVYNAPFDLTITDRESRRYGLPPLTVGPVFDPLVVDKQTNRFVKGKGARRLMPTCARHGIVLTEDEAHTAAGDALATARLAWAIAKLSQIRDLNLTTLMERQRQWFEAQQVSYAQYLKNRKDDPLGAERVMSEKDGWPLRPLVDEFAGQGEVPW